MLENVLLYFIKVIQIVISKNIIVLFIFNFKQSNYVFILSVHKSSSIIFIHLLIF